MAKGGPRKIPLVEWIAALFGAGVVVVMLVFLVREGLRERQHAPALMTVHPEHLAVADGQFVIEVLVSNATRTTGASVHVEGILKSGAADVETSSVTLRYVPGLSHRRAGLVFTHDPRKYRVQFRVTGYERP